MSSQERRSAPREGEITDDQVRGAAMRVIRENLPLDKAKFTEGDEMRDHVRAFLVKIAGISIAEDKSAVSAEKVPTAETAKSKEVRKLSLNEQEKFLLKFLSILEDRFRGIPKHYKRPKGVNFTEVKVALEANPEFMWSLVQMEETGGEPDVIKVTAQQFVFADCSEESPSGRRNCVYDKMSEAELNALDFDDNAVDMAKDMGISLMDQHTYEGLLQKIGKFDRTTFNWLLTPNDLRGTSNHGDALCGHRSRINNSCVVDQGSPCSCQPSRGWRGVLKVPKA